MSCVVLLTNIQNTSKLSHKTISCMHQTWTTQGTKHPAIWYAHSRRSPCLPWYWTPRQLLEFFQLTLKVDGHYQWDILLHYLNICYLLSNTSLMTNFVSSRTAHWHIIHAQLLTVKLQERDLSTSFNNDTHTHPFNGPFPGLPRWAGTRKVKPIWTLLEQETVSGSGISWAICKSAPHSMPAPHNSVFYRPDALPAAQPTVS